MPRPATGTVETRPQADGSTISYRVCFSAYGRRWKITLGTNVEGYSYDRARVELDLILQQVARKTWTPPAAKTHQIPLDQQETVAVTVSRWWARRRHELLENTQRDYRARIEHILRHLQDDQTADLDARRVDQFRIALTKAGLSPRYVNMILDLLAQALDDAVDYRLLDHNPARGRRRRVKVPKPSRSFLEPDMVIDLLDVAGEWEKSLPEHQQYGRRALLALLCLSGGPRINEAIMADRGDIDLHTGRWRIPASKTDAGARDVELTAYTLDELRAHLARRPLKPGQPLFPTRTGGRLNASNLRTRLLPEVVKRANEKRAETGAMTLPRLTPHSCRRTFVSLALAAGRPVPWVQRAVGHADARLTLNVYAKVLDHRFDEKLVWTLMRMPWESEDPVHLSGSSNRPGTAVTVRGTAPEVESDAGAA